MRAITEWKFKNLQGRIARLLAQALEPDKLYERGEIDREIREAWDLVFGALTDISGDLQILRNDVMRLQTNPPLPDPEISMLRSDVQALSKRVETLEQVILKYFYTSDPKPKEVAE